MKYYFSHVKSHLKFLQGLHEFSLEKSAFDVNMSAILPLYSPRLKMEETSSGTLPLRNSPCSKLEKPQTLIGNPESTK